MEITSGNIIASLIAAIILLIFQKLYKIFSKKNIRDDIAYWEFEKKHLEQIQRSSIQLTRSAFKSIFILSSVVSLTNIIPYFYLLVTKQSIHLLSDFVSLLLWAIIFGLSLTFLRRYVYLDNFNQSINKINEKLKKLNYKINRKS